jgi:hypothetical protein
MTSHRHVLTGSYNNFFHIYDREATTDIVLQADKSAFKAKKIGAAKGKAAGLGKPATKMVNGKPVVDVDAIDFNKKILHGAFALAYTSTSSLTGHVQRLIILGTMSSLSRRRTTCVCTLYLAWYLVDPRTALPLLASGTYMIARSSQVCKISLSPAPPRSAPRRGHDIAHARLPRMVFS